MSLNKFTQTLMDYLSATFSYKFESLEELVLRGCTLTPSKFVHSQVINGSTVMYHSNYNKAYSSIRTASGVLYCIHVSRSSFLKVWIHGTRSHLTLSTSGMWTHILAICKENQVRSRPCVQINFAHGDQGLDTMGLCLSLSWGFL